MQVNNNGPLSFNGSFFNFIPSPFPDIFNTTLIAPFWTDNDIRNGGDIFYRVTEDPVCLERARQDILGAGFGPEAEDFDPTFLFIATWFEVEGFGLNDSLVNMHTI